LANAYFVRITTLPALIQDDRSRRLEIVETMFNDEVSSWNQRLPVWLTNTDESSIMVNVDDTDIAVDVVDSACNNVAGDLKSAMTEESTSVVIDTVASIEVLPMGLHHVCTADTPVSFVEETVVDVSLVTGVTSNLASLCDCRDFMRCDHCNIFSKPRRLNGLVFGTIMCESDIVLDNKIDVNEVDNVNAVDPAGVSFDYEAVVCSSDDAGLTTTDFGKAGSILFGTVAVLIGDAMDTSVVLDSDRSGDGHIDTVTVGVPLIDEVFIGGVPLVLVGRDSGPTSVFAVRDEPYNITSTSSYVRGDELCYGPRCISGWYQYAITVPDDMPDEEPETVVPPPTADLSDAIVSNGVRCILVPKRPLLGLLFKPAEYVLNVAMSIYSFYTASVTDFFERLESYIGNDFVCYGYDALYTRFPPGSWSECDFCDRRFVISCRLTDRFNLTGFVGRGCNCCDDCLRQTSISFERHEELAPCNLVFVMLEALTSVARKRHKKFRKPDEFTRDVGCHGPHNLIAFLDNAWLRLADSGRCRALSELCRKYVLFIDSGRVEWMDRNAEAFAEGAYQTLVRAQRT